MIENFKTQQEEFWAGDFGNEYIDRNRLEDMLPGKISFFSKLLQRTKNINSAIEFGANIGTNLCAIHQLLPGAELHAVEINKKAYERLRSHPFIDTALNVSFLEKTIDNQVDLSFTFGVLIHIDPDQLATAYQRLYEASKNYVLIAEYYNPSPVSVSYRGHSERLFKRDFAAEIMSIYPDLALIDYGFAYRHDPLFPMDDITWFLMQKT